MKKFLMVFILSAPGILFAKTYNFLDSRGGFCKVTESNSDFGSALIVEAKSAQDAAKMESWNYYPNHGQVDDGNRFYRVYDSRMHDDLWVEVLRDSNKAILSVTAVKKTIIDEALEFSRARKTSKTELFSCRSKIMTREQLKEKMKEIILKIQAETTDTGKQEEKKKVVKEALDPANLAKKMTFHDLTPGKFMMGEIGAQVATEITKPFAMMQTQVTQMMWSRLKVAMGEKDLNKINPSNFITGTDSITVNIEGIDVQMKPDHPVEQVSYEDVKEFLVGLNQLSNSGDAKDQALLDKLIPGHKKGDVYDLPTEAQWEFTMRDRGNANKKHFDRDDEADVPNHGWYSGNSGNQTHAVATRQPRMIEGKPFFDMEGNVWEWNKDWYDGTLKGGADPQGPTAGSFRVARGGSWFDYAQTLRSGYRAYDSPGNSSNGGGVRLVRTRP